MEYFENEKVEKLQYNDEVLEGIEYYNCKFYNCDFTNLKMKKCKFIDCEFYNCALRNVKFEFCQIKNACFSNSLLMGINWLELQEKGAISFPVETLNNCVIRYNNFVESNLASFDFSSSTISDSRFQDCLLMKASFKNVSFKDTSFSKCNLGFSDFRGANDYDIDINNNLLTRAKFSFPTAICLLNSINIEIE